MNFDALVKPRAPNSIVLPRTNRDTSSFIMFCARKSSKNERMIDWFSNENTLNFHRSAGRYPQKRSSVDANEVNDDCRTPRTPRSRVPHGVRLLSPPSTVGESTEGRMRGSHAGKRVEVRWCSSTASIRRRATDGCIRTLRGRGFRLATRS